MLELVAINEEVEALGVGQEKLQALVGRGCGWGGQVCSLFPMKTEEVEGVF